MVMMTTTIRTTKKTANTSAKTRAPSESVTFANGSKPLAANSPVDRLTSHKRAGLCSDAVATKVARRMRAPQRRDPMQYSPAYTFKKLNQRLPNLNFNTLLILATFIALHLLQPALADQHQHQWQIPRQSGVANNQQQEQWQQYSRIMHELASRQQAGQQHSRPAANSFGHSVQQQLPDSPSAEAMQDPQAAYWTSTSDTNDQSSVYQQQDFGSLVAGSNLQRLQQPVPTTPSINRQLVMPPQFYELGLAQTGALQIDQATMGNNQQGAGGSARSANGARARSLFGAYSGAGQQHNSSEQATDNSAPADQSQISAKDPTGYDQQVSDAPSAGAKDATEKSGSSPESNDSQVAADKQIEPRQRRRIFNRILKKAEWNHLFVELSKVFVRYFLDLALKDIIGKQGGDATTSRKKLDAQTEITDLLRDVVKNAISNM